MDLLAMHDRGALVPRLDAQGVVANGERTLIAKGYLPSWLASRDV
jgi:hypothetical protein